MKLSEIQIGAEYLSRVSGELVTVRVKHANGLPRAPFCCINLRTKAEVWRSPFALRPLPEPRKPHPNADLVARLMTSARCDRATGHFDRGQATRELIVALAAERTEGPRTRIARLVLRREYGFNV